MTNTDDKGGDEPRQIGFWALLKSTAAAFLGVQSNANRERDFRQGKVSHFIWMGLLFGLLFVSTLVGIVQLVMYFTGN